MRHMALIALLLLVGCAAEAPHSSMLADTPTPARAVPYQGDAFIMGKPPRAVITRWDGDRYVLVSCERSDGKGGLVDDSAWYHAKAAAGGFPLPEPDSE